MFFLRESSVYEDDKNTLHHKNFLYVFNTFMDRVKWKNGSEYKRKPDFSDLGLMQFKGPWIKEAQGVYKIEADGIFYRKSAKKENLYFDLNLLFMEKAEAIYEKLLQRKDRADITQVERYFTETLQASKEKRGTLGLYINHSRNEKGHLCLIDADVSVSASIDPENGNGLDEYKTFFRDFLQLAREVVFDSEQPSPLDSHQESALNASKGLQAPAQGDLFDMPPQQGAMAAVGDPDAGSRPSVAVGEVDAPTELQKAIYNRMSRWIRELSSNLLEALKSHEFTLIDMHHGLNRQYTQFILDAGILNELKNWVPVSPYSKDTPHERYLVLDWLFPTYATSSSSSIKTKWMEDVLYDRDIHPLLELALDLKQQIHKDAEVPQKDKNSDQSKVDRFLNRCVDARDPKGLLSDFNHLRDDSLLKLGNALNNEDLKATLGTLHSLRKVGQQTVDQEQETPAALEPERKLKRSSRGPRI